MGGAKKEKWLFKEKKVAYSCFSKLDCILMSRRSKMTKKGTGLESGNQ